MFLAELKEFSKKCEQAQETDSGELWEYMDQAKKLLEEAGETVEAFESVKDCVDCTYSPCLRHEN